MRMVLDVRLSDVTDIRALVRVLVRLLWPHSGEIVGRNESSNRTLKEITKPI
jgi:hypothetical protein